MRAEEGEPHEERDVPRARAETRRLGVEVERPRQVAFCNRRIEREEREELGIGAARGRHRRAADAVRTRERKRAHVERAGGRFFDAERELVEIDARRRPRGLGARAREDRVHALAEAVERTALGRRLRLAARHRYAREPGFQGHRTYDTSVQCRRESG
jgi:hypothetical protein